MNRLNGLRGRVVEKSRYFIEVDGQPVAVNLTLERRNNCRASIGKTGINIRLARQISRKEQQRQTEHFLNWARNQIRLKGLPSDPPGKTYENGREIIIGGQAFNLQIQPVQTKSGTGRIVANNMILKVPAHLDAAGQRQIKSDLVAGLASRYFLPGVRNRVIELNKIHFNKPFGHVRLKNNRSNWGSCSARSNINLSTRLLLAPPLAMDYVIIHELAHLTHHNHSKQFWNLVQTAMPNYREQEKWLKQFGHTCVF